MTEFTSSHGVVHAQRARKVHKAHRYLYFDAQEHPISAQLFGSDPVVMAEAARICEDQGFDALDVNFGCPVNKVVKCNGGSGLLRDLPLVAEILAACRQAVKIPLTCKFRGGWNHKELVYKEMGKIAEDNGLSAVALHARTREMGYSGEADWTWIAALKAHVRIPVIGNGDVRSPEDAVRMVRETGCDAVMIGRAASANPWIFKQMGEHFATGHYSQPSEEMRYRIMRRYFQMLLDQQDFRVSVGDIVGKMKQFTTYFTHGVRNGSKLRVAIYSRKTGEEIMDEVEQFFERELSSVAA
jgi:nifR3 family TIM-barrel protein